MELDYEKVILTDYKPELISSRRLWKVCGGPIDVMVFQTAPEPRTLAYPGKELHHPHRRGYKT